MTLLYKSEPPLENPRRPRHRRRPAILSYMSHESVLSVGGACACLAPRPLIPPFEAALLRVGVESEVFGLGRLMPSAPSMSLEPLETSAGGRPGRASSTVEL